MENINIKVILDKVLVNLVIVIIPHKFDYISNTIVCEDNSVISLADDGRIELRNYDIVIIHFNS